MEVFGVSKGRIKNTHWGKGLVDILAKEPSSAVFLLFPAEVAPKTASRLRQDRLRKKVIIDALINAMPFFIAPSSRFAASRRPVPKSVQPEERTLDDADADDDG